ncbi:hypothetical protein ACFVHB_04660 [Kitasatospora sp. NPDC127111]|uniref:hypothetical protein n=1 Tax=Kitasatospora sp. NPDC127111 TaxID=3345363 RepID=UPI003638816E
MIEPDNGAGGYRPGGHGPRGFGPGRYEPAGYESGAYAAGGSGAETDAEVERELRVLLDRAAPDLPAPADRMERIRERADRARRRRRTAALAAGLTTGLVAAALAAAPALAPGASVALHPASAGPGTASTGATGAPGTRPSPSAGGNAGTGPGAAENTGAGTAGGAEAGPTPSVAPSDSPAPTIIDRPLRFPDLGGVMIDVPAGWTGLAAMTGKPSSATGYLASQPLYAKASCTPRQESCEPVDKLVEGGTLITLTAASDRPQAEKIYGFDGPAVAIEVDKTCHGRGGTAQLVGHRAVILDYGMDVVELSACLNRPSDAALRQVQKLLDSLRNTGTAPAAPDSIRG